MGGSLFRNSAVALLVIAVAATPLWGCGGGSDGADAGQKQAGKGDKKAFLEEANAICAEGKSRGLARVRVYLKRHEESSESKATLIAQALEVEFLPQIGKQVEEIRELDVPPGDEQQVDAILTAMEEAVDRAGRRGGSGQPGLSFKRSASLARGYGLTDCAYG